MITVLIADDHEMFRDLLCRLLEDDPGITVIGEASTGAETLNAVQENRPDVVLLDLGLPDLDGLSVARELKSLDPRQRILVLTSLHHQEYAVRSLQAGVEGYLTKERSLADLRAAVLKIHAGGRYLPAELAEALALGTGQDDSDAYGALSAREKQVLSLVAQGSSTTEIARGLDLSLKTVSTYRARIRDKLALRNTAEIVRYAVRHGLLD